jgi:acetoin:2,6-dichlorophenolindophenol oxidoreductase subunit alpha
MPSELDQLEEMYVRMLRIRAFETRITELFEQKAFRGPAHQYIGMEAIAVGVCAALREDDYITSTHRGHGHCIAKGLELRPMMAEILGRATGYCKGKGGSMHITALRHGMLGTDAVVGGSLAIAVGAGYGLQLQGKDAVIAAFFGDGAINQGLFHEAANLAAVLAAPVVFVCENNQWAISTPIETVTRIGDLATRADAYGFAGEVVDGNDVVAVRDVAGAAVERARAGGGPRLIEAKSFRVRPHSASSQSDDRSPDLISAWEKRDPIGQLERRLADQHGVGAERLSELGDRVTAELQDAVEYALASPAPDPESAIEDVYAPSSWSKPGRLA